MQDINGGKEMSVDCAFALVAMGVAAASVVIATDGLGSMVATVSAKALAGWLLSLFGSGLAGKDIITTCL